jgi:hypothetical protein
MVGLIASFGGGIPLLLSRILALRISRVEPGYRPATTRARTQGLRAQLAVVPRWVVCGHIRLTSN